MPLFWYFWKILTKQRELFFFFRSKTTVKWHISIWELYILKWCFVLFDMFILNGREYLSVHVSNIFQEKWAILVNSFLLWFIPIFPSFPKFPRNVKLFCSTIILRNLNQENIIHIAYISKIKWLHFKNSMKNLKIQFTSTPVPSTHNCCKHFFSFDKKSLPWLLFCCHGFCHLECHRINPWLHAFENLWLWSRT